MIALTSAAAFSLAACGSEEVEEPVVNEALVQEDIEDEGYPVAGELTPEQQSSYDAYDWEAASEEYDTNVGTMREEMAASGAGASDAAMSADSGMEADGSDDAMMAGTGGGSGIPPRGEMSFSWLDRNSDGQLSVAEYAIWALPTDPGNPVPNDQTRPYLTQDQINQAGQTFFYFDNDGSTYLSETEFQEARNSAMTA